jgi:Skp family chaperone for outer membrane proteins
MAQSTLPKPLYAFAGAGDIAAEQLKRLASHAPEIQARAAELPAELRKMAAELPREVQNLATDIPSLAAQLQARARDLDVETVTAAVRKNVESAQHKAVDVYDELVARGQKAVAKRQDGVRPTTKKPATAKKPVAKKAPAKPAAAKAEAKVSVNTPSTPKPGGSTTS